MDKKVRNRILYVTVALLWTIAFYRTWQNFDAPVEEAFTYTEAFTPSLFKFGKDSFELILPEKDPFLVDFETPEQPVAKTNDTEKKADIPKEKTNPPEKKWPSLEYFGFVRNRQVNSTLCLLKVDGKLVKLNPGEDYQNVKIGRAFHDSVEVIFSGEKKIIEK